jgi:hypothetical protein
MKKNDNLVGKGFDKNPQNINRSGANRKTIGVVNKELEDKGITEATTNDIKSCYLRLINHSIPELTELVKNDKHPALVRIVGKAILSGKGIDIIEKVLDRALGKATQQTDITTQGKSLNITISRATNGTESE